MELTQDQRDRLGVALNEANLLGFDVVASTRIAAATFLVLTLPEHGDPPEDRRVQFLFRDVSRVAVSLRDGAWDDPNASVVRLSLDELPDAVAGFGGEPIYGWDFFDVHESQLAKWGDRLSLDWTAEPVGPQHSIFVFQSLDDRILDLCCWFGEFEIRNPNGALISLDDFISGGMRWWEHLHAGDPRTQGFGIAPAKDFKRKD